jgi:hypothetical protein
MGMDFNAKLNFGPLMFIIAGTAFGAGVGLIWGLSLITTGPYIIYVDTY